MDLKALAEQVGAMVVALSAFSGGAYWLFKEKIHADYERRLVKALGGDPEEDTPREALAAAIDLRVQERFGSTLGGWDEWRRQVEAEQDQLGGRMAEQERTAERIAQAFEAAAEAIGDGVKRLTIQVERIAESHDETREQVAHIKGWVDGQKGTTLGGVR